MLLAKMKYTTIPPLMCMTAVVAIMAVQDPCTSYKSFTDIRERLPSNVINTGTTGLSDMYIEEGWYGDIGVEIPTKESPGRYHCGTVNPIYLKDDVSESRKEELQEICIDNGGNNTCMGDHSIKTKYCGQFRVYFLTRLGRSNVAYCAGLPKTAGEHPNYTTPCTVDVTLEPVSDGVFGFVFVCNFNQSIDPLWYTVYWYVNGVIIYSTPAHSVDVNNQTRLIEKNLKEAGIEAVGFKIKCGLRTSFENNSSLGLPTYSDYKFIGFEILTPIIEVKVGHEKQISVRATAPIGCADNSCYIHINMFGPDNTDTCKPSLKYSDCGLMLGGNDTSKPGIMIVHAKTTTTYGNVTSLGLIHLRSMRYFMPHPIWANSFVGEITVRITKDTKPIDGKSCHAVCDPHMLTFNNHKYEHQYEGIFTLYRSVKLQQEVQIQTEPCNADKAQCICGMVLRSGKIVYELNHCGNETKWTIGYTLCKDMKSLLTVKWKGNLYKIFFGSGTRVEATLQTGPIYGRFMNVYIYPSIMDIDKVDGLCGQLLTDGSTSELYYPNGTTVKLPENYKHFSESWRVKDVNDNLFLKDELDHGLASGGVSVFICNCDGVSGTSNVLNNTACLHTNTCATITTYTDATTCTLNSKTKRSANKQLTDWHPLPENRLSEHSMVKRDAEEGWRNGWTEVKARKYCLDLFNQSKAVQICQDVPNVDSIGPLDNCILDIQLMGDTSFSTVAVETIKNKCYHEVEANLTLQKPTKPGQPSIFEQIKEVACPNECSLHGTCNKGICDCDENFGCVDCSVDIGIPPQVKYLGNDGYCDLADDDCSEISAFGGIFVDAKHSSCKFRISELRENGTTEDKGELINAMDTESISEAICILPHTRQRRSVSMVPEAGITNVYKVSVTNNGASYSNERVVVVFNSRCQYCTIYEMDVSCSFTGDFCMSRTDCYGNGEPLTANECYLCYVNGTSRSWVYSTAPKCNPTTETVNATDDEEQSLWIIGVVIGVVALILLSVFVMWYINKRRKQGSIDLN